MPATLDMDTRSQELFWSKLTQLKFDLNYYHQHFANCVTISRWIRFGIVAVTAGISGAWMAWPDVAWIRFISPAVVLALQIINATLNVLPYEKRKQELRELTTLLKPVYTEMETDWYLIADGQCTCREVAQKTAHYEKKRQNIQQHYLQDDVLPERMDIIEKAEKDTSAYFASLFEN